MIKMLEFYKALLRPHCTYRTFVTIPTGVNVVNVLQNL